MTNYVVNASSGKVLDDTNCSTSNGNLIAAVAAHRRDQPAVDVHLARRRQRPDRQRGQRQGARRPRLLDQQRHQSSSSTSSTAALNQQWSSSRWRTATTKSSTRTAARCSTTRTPRPATAPDPAVAGQRRHEPAMEHQPIRQPGVEQPYSPAPAGIPLFNKGGPSYLDVEQGVTVGDCWLMASLAEVAAGTRRSSGICSPTTGPPWTTGPRSGSTRSDSTTATGPGLRQGGHGTPRRRRLV